MIDSIVLAGFIFVGFSLFVFVFVFALGHFFPKGDYHE